MFIEKIDGELLEEIREELEEEYSQIVASWDGKFIDLKGDDLDDTLRTEIYEHYHHIPFYKLEDMLDQHFPFIKEKDISIEPHSNIIISKNDDYDDVEIQVYADVFPSERNRLTKVEAEKFDILLKELTQLYYEVLDIETTLTITHIPIEDVPKGYYVINDVYGEDDYDFVQIEF